MSRKKRTSAKQALSYSFIVFIALIAAIFTFIKENLVIFIIIAVIIIGIIIYFFIRKSVPKTDKTSDTFEGKKLVLPKIEISAKTDQEVKDLIDFVYGDGTHPINKILSKKNQHNILCQIFVLDIDLAKYEPFIQNIYEKAITKINTYASIVDSDERYEGLRFAFESTIANIIELSLNKSKARICFNAIDNFTDRLLQMDRERFKNLFFRLHGYHFWHVYNQDEDYKMTSDKIKKRLKLYHGIRQTEFYKKCSETKDDISYTLYFAEKAGEIIRKQEGRTYRLYLPGDNIDEIPKYEYTRAAVYDGDFNYKIYWKDIEKLLNKNAGILQTEFYSNFDYPSEIIQHALKDAEQDEKVIREKKGNTYLLYLPDQWVRRDKKS
jgi:hypothetical protein